MGTASTASKEEEDDLKKDPVTEAELEVSSKAPRVTPQDIEDNIIREVYFTAGQAAVEFDQHTSRDAGLDPEVQSLDLLTICVIVLRNGFTLLGTSACASKENYNQDIGEKIARENAVEQIWPLMGYELRSQLHQQASASAQRAVGERQAEEHDAVGTGEAEASLLSSLSSSDPFGKGGNN